MYDDDVRIVFGKLRDQFLAPSVQRRLRKFETCGMPRWGPINQLGARTMQGTNWIHPKKGMSSWTLGGPGRSGNSRGIFAGPGFSLSGGGANLRVFARNQAEFRNEPHSNPTTRSRKRTCKNIICSRHLGQFPPTNVCCTTNTRWESILVEFSLMDGAVTLMRNAVVRLNLTKWMCSVQTWFDSRQFAHVLACRLEC